MSYRPDIDGLRAIAVLSVVFYHARLGFPGGYVGVDVFFVISGYLISAILLKSISAGTFSYLDFWERRVRRLVPALALATFVTALVSCVILVPQDLADLGGALVAQPLLLSNVYFWRVVKGGYFGDPPEIRPLLHTWSLGVEEQFYVFFPLLLMLVFARTKSRRVVGTVLGCTVLMSMGLGVYLTPIREVLAFFVLPTRAWELLLGALLHFVPKAASRTLGIRQLCSLVGLALVAFSIFFYTHSTPFPGVAALVPCLGTAMVIWGAEHTWIGRWLSLPAMVFVGQISYSLYLWHWPIMAWTGYFGKLGSIAVKTATILLSFWLGYLSWRWVETPVRQKRALAGRKGLGLLLLAYLSGTIALGILLLKNEGFPQAWPAYTRKPADETHRHFLYDYKSSDSRQDFLALGDSSQLELSFLLWGDSHAMSLGAVLDSLGQEYRFKGIQLTSSGTPPLSTLGKTDYTRRSAEFLRKWRQDAAEILADKNLKVVFLAGFWSRYAHSECSSDFQETALWIREVAGNPRLRVVFVQDFPVFDSDPVRRAQLLSRWTFLDGTFMIDEVEHRARNAEVERALVKVWKDGTLDPARMVLRWPSLYRKGDSQILYFDADHLTDYGALELRPIFEPIFKTATSF